MRKICHFINTFRYILLAIALMTLSLTLAQKQLLINGHEANTGFYKDDELFILVKEFAQIVNAKYALDGETGVFSIDLNGHLLIGRQEDGSTVIDGKGIELSMTEEESQLFVGVKGLADAFGGNFAIDEDRAYLIFPRAQLKAFDLTSFDGYDRIVLDIDGFSSVKELYSPEPNVVTIVFDNLLEHSQEVLYGHQTVFELSSSKGYLNLKLILAQGSSYSSYFEASDRGFKMIIDIFEAGVAQHSNNQKICLISSLPIAEELKKEFERESIDLRIYRTEKDAENLLQNDICFALSFGELPRSQVKIFYKDGNKGEFLIQENAAKAIGFNNNPKRQIVLEKLASNYAFGQALALRIAYSIYQTMGYRAAVIAEDIDLLKKFSGKAVYIEISEEDATNLLLMQAISQSIISFVKPND